MDQLLFLLHMDILENMDSTESEIMMVIDQIRDNLKESLDHTPMTSSEKNSHLECLETIDYWSQCLNDIKQLNQLTDLKPIILKYYATTNKHNFSKYNVAQGIMKATSHLLWKKLGQLCPDQLCPCHTAENAGIFHFQSCVITISQEKGFNNVHTFMDYLESNK